MTAPSTWSRSACAVLLAVTAAACGSETVSTPDAGKPADVDAEVSADTDATTLVDSGSSVPDAATPDAAPADVAPTDVTVADAAADSKADATADSTTLDATVVSGTVQVVGAGWSFGECMGLCKGEAKLEGAKVVLTLTSWDGKTPAEDHHGLLTTGAAAQLDDATAKLTGATLQDIYGCPDCADGGAAWVKLQHGDVTTLHTYEFGKPPAVLQGVAAVIAPALATLRDCKIDMTLVTSYPCPWVEP